MKRLLKIVAVFLLGFVLLFFVGNGLVFLVEVPWLLVFGWYSFLHETLPAVRPDVPAIITALLAFGLLTGGLHIGVRRLLASRPASHPGIWKLRWTIASISLVLLLFTAGIGLVGVVHHVAWMTFGEQPVLLMPMWNQRGLTMHQLEQIGTALTDVFADRNEFPPAGELNSRGQPMHSVLTTLLPHLDVPALQIDPAKPWNHPNNKPAFSTPVKQFQLPLPAHYRSANEPVNGYAVANYAGNQHVFRLGRPLPLDSITDGLSNTIFFGQVIERPSAWGDPLNLRDPARSLHGDPAGYSGFDSRGVCVLLGDGSVQWLDQNTATETLKALSTPAGGAIPGR
ncbi:MAG: DUF1559 domain-containing protein [Planctomycetota bacterium]